MPKFSQTSLEKLRTCELCLHVICHEAIKIYDFTILCGHRSVIEQNKLYTEGRTKLQYPQSKHNYYPSKAIDIAPYPIDWDDAGRFKILAGIMFGIAHYHDVNLRWGGDWSGNWKSTHQTFDDLSHFEIN